MTISATEAINYHRYFYFGFESHPTDKDPWQATPIMAYSDNLVEWVTVGTTDQLGELRDGFVKKIGSNYYIIGTGGFYKTNDFIGFQKLGYITNTDNWKNVWAPEIFEDNSGKYHIVFCAGDSSQGQLDVYLTDFDPETDTVGSTNTKVSFQSGAIDNDWKIDPDICVIDGIYYLTIGGNYLFSSNDYLGPYQRFPTNFAPTPQKFGNHDSSIAGWVEGPQLFADGDSVRLYADQTSDNGLVFRSATKDNLFDWTDATKTHAQFKMRHGSILVNEKVTAQVDANVDDAPKFDKKISIQGLNAKQPVPLTCFLNNSFQYQYEDNQTNQIQFVAYDDGTPSFAYIANESTITFNNDLFIIKSVEGDDTGSQLYTVTATQYVNSEVGRVRQRNIKSGTLTYSVQDVLDFFLNDKVANPFGFSYCVYGDFDKQQIENLGGCSGKDMVSKIIETWPGTIIYPKGKTLNVFAPDDFHKNYQRKITYKADSSDMKLIEDSTGIVNQVLCIGATKDDTDSTTDNTSDDSGLTVTHPVQTIVTGVDDTSGFQADAKKYLGVPYVWGGHNKANPWAGMDCSGYVSQVYHDFGIEIPAYTVAMENSFREIPYSEVKAGDVGFYGPHGATHHISLMLDHNTMIYEPEPGENCKTAPVSSYAPSWYGRNDQMQAKINTKKTETVEGEHITYHDDYSASSVSTDTTQDYYFQPFIVQDDQSIAMWGLHPGEDIQDDRFKDIDSMKSYGKKQLVTDPVVSFEAVLRGNAVPVPGEQIFLVIPERGDALRTQDSYTTTVTVVGYTWYPFDKNQGTDITFNNLQASILHSRSANSVELKRIEQLANAALDRMPQVFYGQHDPSAEQKVKNGAIWIKPIESHVTDDDKGGETNNAGKQSSLRQNETRSDG